MIYLILYDKFVNDAYILQLNHIKCPKNAKHKFSLLDPLIHEFNSVIGKHNL